MSKPPSPLIEKIYRLMLNAYPADFRQQYEPYLVQHFNDCYKLARQEAGFQIQLRFWIGITTDLLQTAVMERIDEMRKTHWWFWLIVSFLGLGIGYIDYTAEEVQATLLFLLPTAFIFGFLEPRKAWFSALIIGLSIPVVHVIGHVLNIIPPYHDYVIASLLALAPSFIAAYSGAVLRWLAGKSFSRLSGF
ncbi:MAG: hypothetical protein WAM60_14980 [Candidatus Promineifilaceae bacterium]